ncbi:hypothetical protein L210DRAFT_3509112 [Boletus edulis BED1]|uniref:Uncharacterized protein n=1 Tax=Boletus edulis BED1 TaxID=1328754 RepID=A0AAD4BFZ3_BOLED|nr:hypothetical protein L210DRAFT_3509112 [Boletus edulis BED1]
MQAPPRQAHAPFRIPSENGPITLEEWAAYEPAASWYGIPIEVEHTRPDGERFVTCRVEAMNQQQQTVGYLPLPRRYAKAWVHLCYTVVYYLSVWRAWASEVGQPHRVRGQPKNLAEDCANNNATRLTKYLVIRRLIVDELLQHRLSENEGDQLDVFDEFLIREQWEWLWTPFEDVPSDQLDKLRLDPVADENSCLTTKKFTGWLGKSDELMPPEMIAPPVSPSQTWIWGKINHFDFERFFSDSFKPLTRYYRDKGFRKCDDRPYGKNATPPTMWNEAHEPAVHFLTEQEALERELNAIQHLSAVQRGYSKRRPAGPSFPNGSWPIVFSDGSKWLPDGSFRGNDRTDRPIAPSWPIHARYPGPGGFEPAIFRGRTADSWAASFCPAELKPREHATQRLCVVDKPQTRSIVESFADPGSGMSLAMAHDELQKELGDDYSAELWGNMLDGLHAEPGEQPRFTVDQAFQEWGQMDGRASAEEGGADYMRHIFAQYH